MTVSSNVLISGDLRTLFRISLPLMLFLFCETLTSFCERIFLSYYSIEGVHVSLNATYLANIFQTPCVAIGAMGQVFVGLYQGSGDLKRVGPCVWQLIWFSALSLCITFPISQVASSLYFKNTSMYQAGTEYFNVLARGNFLFPLSISLSSFYLGRGKTAFVTSLMMISYALNLILSWFLIFGIPNFLPSLGIKGAALAKCCSLGFLCASFFIAFLSEKNRKTYNTHEWQFSPSIIWNYMRPGLIRGFGYLSSKVWWAGITYLMIKKGGSHLEVLTVGGTVVTFLVFIASGIYRSVLTISSNLIGSKNYREIRNLLRSLIIYIFMIAILIMIPLILLPHSLAFFFHTSSKDLFGHIIPTISVWLWFYIIALALQMGLCGFIVSARELKLQLFCYLFVGVTSCIPIYLTLYKGDWHPDKLWLIMAFENVILAAIFLYRLQQRSWKEKQATTSF